MDSKAGIAKSTTKLANTNGYADSASNRSLPVGVDRGTALPRVNGFSVDIEDWYQVADFDAVAGLDNWSDYESRIVQNTERVLEILDEFRVTGTFFVLTWNAPRNPDLIRRIARGGHEVACHGHAHRLIYEQTPKAFREDVTRAKALLEDITGSAVLGYRAPSFSITEHSLWALDVLLDCGFRYDSSIFPIRDSLYGLPTAPRFPHVIRERGHRTLIEFPITTTRTFGRNLPLGGGAYLRIMPYSYMRWGIRRVNRVDHQPALVYVHPWEMDPGQPKMRTAGRRGFSTHYIGLSGMETKVRSLLRDFRFGPLREVLGVESC